MAELIQGIERSGLSGGTWHAEAEETMDWNIGVSKSSWEHSLYFAVTLRLIAQCKHAHPATHVIISTIALGILFYVATILISVLHPDNRIT
jgi:hypothetical protein